MAGGMHGGGGVMCDRQACMVGGGMYGRGCAWLGACVAGDGHCSGRYASYWNAFLLQLNLSAFLKPYASYVGQQRQY